MEGIAVLGDGAVQFLRDERGWGPRFHSSKTRDGW